MDGDFVFTAEAQRVLLSVRSWKLERVSPTTYHGDLTSRIDYLTLEEINLIRTTRLSGFLYRFRISNQRWFFALDYNVAIMRAFELYAKPKEVIPKNEAVLTEGCTQA